MTVVNAAPIQHHKNPHAVLSRVQELFRKQSLVNTLMEKQAPSMPRHDLVQGLVDRQHLNELRRQINQSHPADIAFVLEGLPLEQRLTVWRLLEPERLGAVLLETSDTVRDSLLEGMGQRELVSVVGHLDSDDLADLLPDLPSQFIPELLKNRASHEQEQLQEALAFPPDTVGSLMSLDFVGVRLDNTLDTVLRYLRRRGRLPTAANLLMVVDRTGHFKGVVPYEAVLINAGEARVSEVMAENPVVFHTDDPIHEAADAFSRYDLISTPVVNSHGQLVGCLNVEAVLEYVQENSQKNLLAQAGLRDDEDLFASVWQSGLNRWPWLALNLLIAFLSSRIIGQFETTIAQVVALATLMPITANMGGNAGNQAMALVIRSLALNQLNRSNLPHLVRKELTVGLLNGCLWGGIMAALTGLLYQQVLLAGIMLVAMMLILLLAPLAGLLVPILLKRTGHDPVLGSSIIITGITDSLGFFIFLGLASWVF